MLPPLRCLVSQPFSSTLWAASGSSWVGGRRREKEAGNLLNQHCEMYQSLQVAVASSFGGTFVSPAVALYSFWGWLCSSLAGGSQFLTLGLLACLPMASLCPSRQSSWLGLR